MSTELVLHTMLLLPPELSSHEQSPAQDGVSAASCHSRPLGFVTYSTSHAVVLSHGPRHAVVLSHGPTLHAESMSIIVTGHDDVVCMCGQ